MKNMKSMSGVQPEGVIGKKMNTSNKPSSQRLRGSIHPNLNSSSSSNSNLSSTQRLRKYFTTLSSTGRNVGRGENEKSNLTPIKRKLLESKQVPNLVKVLNDRVHDVESGESIQTGSPAKRRRLESRGQTTQQPAANYNVM